MVKKEGGTTRERNSVPIAAASPNALQWVPGKVCMCPLRSTDHPASTYFISIIYRLKPLSPEEHSPALLFIPQPNLLSARKASPFPRQPM